MAPTEENIQAFQAEMRRRYHLNQFRLREEQIAKASGFDELYARVPESEIMSEEEMLVFMANNRPLTPGGGGALDLLRKCCPSMSMEGTLLDVGCGTGELTVVFAMSFPYLKVTGVDASELCIREARKLAASMDLANPPEFVQARLPRDELNGRRFNTVFSRSALHHFAKGSGFWAAVKRHVEKDGAVCVFDLMRPRTRKIAQIYVDSALFEDASSTQRCIYLESILSSHRIYEVRADLQLVGLEGVSVSPTEDGMHLVACRDSKKENTWVS